jgi:hypothetical protein
MEQSKRSQYLTEYLQYKGNMSFLNHDPEKAKWTLEKVKGFGAVKFIELLNGQQEVITWLDGVVSSVQEGASDWENDCKALQAKCDRYEALLRGVHKKAKEGIFPHLPVETMGAQKCIEIDKVLTEALSAGEGDEKEKKPEWWTGKTINDMPEYIKVINEGCANDTGLYCKVHKWSKIDNILPDLKSQIGAELVGYEPDYLIRSELNFPGQIYGRLNAVHLLPATKEEYEAYLQTHSNNK